MKAAFDIVQWLLGQPYAYAACLLLALAILQGWKVLRKFCAAVILGLRLIRSVLLKRSKGNVALVLFLGSGLWLSSAQLSDFLQWLEDHCSPIYAGQYDSLGTEHEAAIFEQELHRRVKDSYVCEVVKRETAATAQRLGCPRLWIYQCALSECGLNPFVVRSDKIAASWCQLTRTGLTGIKIDGRQATMADVIAACDRRDIETIMAMADTYLVDRWLAQGSPMLRGAVDVYLLLFAPGFTGQSMEKVLYQGYGNPNYDLNAGFDGYLMKEGGQIVRANSAKDGRITVGELALCVESRKNSLISEYLK